MSLRQTDQAMKYWWGKIKSVRIITEKTTEKNWSIQLSNMLQEVNNLFILYTLWINLLIKPLQCQLLISFASDQ